jgi:restriction endonuclease S subunit
LLKGLEVSEIYVSKLERTTRLDSEFYSKFFLEIEEKLKKLDFEKISELTKVSDGNHAKISDYFSDEGVPYYRGGDIYNFFIEHAKAQSLKIPLNVYQWENMKRSHLKKGDVLMSIVGAIIGNLSLVNNDERATCSCKLAILRPKTGKIDSNYLAIYLKSKFGQSQVQRLRRGSGQTGFILEDFEQLFVALPSDKLVDKVNELVTNSYDSLNQSNKTYQQAEELLLEELGLRDFQPSEQGVNIKSLKDSFLSTGRLDAEYYQPKYEQIESLITNYYRGAKKVSDEYELVTKKIDFTKQAYNYIEIGDIEISSGSNTYNLVNTEDLPANAKIIPKLGDILISKVRPYRGAVSIIDNNINDLVVSGAFTVLRPKKESKYNVELLKCLLRTKIYKDWLLKFNVGTSYPVIKDDDILNLPIPNVSIEIQNETSELIQQSFALKAKSEQLLENAKTLVEMAIEQGEEKALTNYELGLLEDNL